jgi:hypothetical protein
MMRIQREKPRVNRATRDRLAFTSCGEAPSQSAFSRETDKNTSERPGQKLKPVLRQTEIARTPCFRHKAEGGGGATRDFKKTFVHGSSSRLTRSGGRKRLIHNRNFYSPIF